MTISASSSAWFQIRSICRPSKSILRRPFSAERQWQRRGIRSAAEGLHDGPELHDRLGELVGRWGIMHYAASGICGDRAVALDLRAPPPPRPIRRRRRRRSSPPGRVAATVEALQLGEHAAARPGGACRRLRRSGAPPARGRAASAVAERTLEIGGEMPEVRQLQGERLRARIQSGRVRPRGASRRSPRRGRARRGPSATRRGQRRPRGRMPRRTRARSFPRARAPTRCRGRPARASRGSRR